MGTVTPAADWMMECGQCVTPWATSSFPTTTYDLTATAWALGTIHPGWSQTPPAWVTLPASCTWEDSQWNCIQPTATSQGGGIPPFQCNYYPTYTPMPTNTPSYFTLPLASSVPFNVVVPVGSGWQYAPTVQISFPVLDDQTWEVVGMYASGTWHGTTSNFGFQHTNTSYFAVTAGLAANGIPSKSICVNKTGYPNACANVGLASGRTLYTVGINQNNWFFRFDASQYGSNANSYGTVSELGLIIYGRLPVVTSTPMPDCNMQGTQWADSAQQTQAAMGTPNFMTQTAMAGANYCGSVNDWEDDPGLDNFIPNPIVSPGVCQTLGGFEIGLSWISQLAEMAGIGFPDELSVPAVQVCFRELSFGYWKIFNNNINMDAAVMVLSIIAFIRILFRS